MMGIVLRETCWACNKICNKYHLLHLVGISFSHNNDDARSKSLQISYVCFLFCFWCNSPQWARFSSFTRFLDHTQRRSTVGMTSLDEWSARRRDLYLTTHNTRKRQTPMPWWDSNPQSQQASGRRPTLDRAATGIGQVSYIDCLNYSWSLLQRPRFVPHLCYNFVHSVVLSNSL